MGTDQESNDNESTKKKTLKGRKRILEFINKNFPYHMTTGNLRQLALSDSFPIFTIGNDAYSTEEDILAYLETKSLDDILLESAEPLKNRLGRPRLSVQCSDPAVINGEGIQRVKKYLDEEQRKRIRIVKEDLEKTRQEKKNMRFHAQKDYLWRKILTFCDWRKEDCLMGVFKIGCEMIKMGFTEVQAARKIHDLLIIANREILADKRTHKKGKIYFSKKCYLKNIHYTTKQAKIEKRFKINE